MADPQDPCLAALQAVAAGSEAQAIALEANTAALEATRLNAED